MMRLPTDWQWRKLGHRPDQVGKVHLIELAQHVRGGLTVGLGQISDHLKHHRPAQSGPSNTTHPTLGELQSRHSKIDELRTVISHDESPAIVPSCCAISVPHRRCSLLLHEPDLAEAAIIKWSPDCQTAGRPAIKRCSDLCQGKLRQFHQSSPARRRLLRTSAADSRVAASQFVGRGVTRRGVLEIREHAL